MKKTLLTVLIGSSVALSAMAQGTVNFENEVIGEFVQLIYGPQSNNSALSGSSAADTPSGTTAYDGGLLSGTRYVAQLWYGANTVTDPTALTLVPSSDTTFQLAANAGKFNTIFDLAIPGNNPGNTVTLQVRVYDTTTGGSFATAGTKGSSGLFNSGQLGGASGANIFFTPDPENWQSFNLVAASVVPEPSTFALAGLGAAALLIFRRRK